MKVEDCAACTRETDNKHFSCPPRMADGRHFTDYKPRCLMMDMGKYSKEPMDSYQLRQFLINNAERIMDNSRKDAFTRNICGPCVEPFKQGTMVPEQSMVECNSSTCKVTMTNPSGLGQGRSYDGLNHVNRREDQFLAQRDVLNKQLAEKNNCCSAPNDDANFYPLNGVIEDTSITRTTIPSGAMPISGTSRTPMRS